MYLASAHKPSSVASWPHSSASSPSPASTVPAAVAVGGACSPSLGGTYCSSRHSRLPFGQGVAR